MLKPFYKPDRLEAGCDEAGRGCLAGPVFAAAVILPPSYKHPLLNDSKKLTDRDRRLLRVDIEEKAISCAVSEVNPEKIDEINILNASFLAMHLAIESLTVAPDFLLIDGNRFKPYKDYSFECIVKGDGKYQSIAAASILAKTYRDDFMIEQGNAFPYYNWQKNKGYPTKEHRVAIQKYGICPLHRKSFQLLPDSSQIKLF